MTYDKIFDVVRAAFMDRKGARLKNAERGWRRLMCEFMQCIWCTGMWSGLIVVTVYFLGTGALCGDRAGGRRLRLAAADRVEGAGGAELSGVLARQPPPPFQRTPDCDNLQLH